LIENAPKAAVTQSITALSKLLSGTETPQSIAASSAKGFGGLLNKFWSSKAAK
jgi:hypothetical protein